ncbi:hypothetical protein HK104_004101 [Borealophlyctis nickersoniae]|nr:hypothetical protein HK104_004101 [Borealophlyctis nickersoniae]
MGDTQPALTLQDTDAIATICVWQPRFQQHRSEFDVASRLEAGERSAALASVSSFLREACEWVFQDELQNATEPALSPLLAFEGEIQEFLDMVLRVALDPSNAEGILASACTEENALVVFCATFLHIIYLSIQIKRKCFRELEMCGASSDDVVKLLGDRYKVAYKLLETFLDLSKKMDTVNNPNARSVQSSIATGLLPIVEHAMMEKELHVLNLTWKHIVKLCQSIGAGEGDMHMNAVIAALSRSCIKHVTMLIPSGEKVPKAALVVDSAHDFEPNFMLRRSTQSSGSYPGALLKRSNMDDGAESITSGLSSIAACILQSSSLPETSKTAFLGIVTAAPELFADDLPSGFGEIDLQVARASFIAIVLKTVDDSMFKSKHLFDQKCIELFRLLLDDVRRCCYLDFRADAGPASLYSTALISSAVWAHSLSQNGWELLERELFTTLISDSCFITGLFAIDLASYIMNHELFERWVMNLNQLLDDVPSNGIGRTRVKWLLTRLYSMRNRDATPDLYTHPPVDDATLRNTMEQWSLWAPQMLLSVPQDQRQNCLDVWDFLCGKLEADPAQALPCFDSLRVPAECVQRFLIADELSMDRSRLEALAEVIPFLLEGGLSAMEVAKEEKDSARLLAQVGLTSATLVSLGILMAGLFASEQLNDLLGVFDGWSKGPYCDLMPLSECPCQVYGMLERMGAVDDERLSELFERGLGDKDWLVVHEALAATVNYAKVSAAGPPNLSDEKREMVIRFIEKSAWGLPEDGLTDKFFKRMSETNAGNEKRALFTSKRRKDINNVNRMATGGSPCMDEGSLRKTLQALQESLADEGQREVLLRCRPEVAALVHGLQTLMQQEDR